MSTYEYTTAPTGTIHLTLNFFERTLCGRPISEGFTLGDETIDGTAATCERCLSSIPHPKGR